MLNKSFFYINVVFCALFTTLLSHTLETLTPPLIFKLPIQSKKPIKQSHSVSLEKILTRGQTFCCLKKEKEMFGLDNIASIIVTPQELTPTCISFKYACEDLKEYENVLINCSTNWVIRTHLINEYQNEFNKVVISNSSRFKCFDKQLSAKELKKFEGSIKMRRKLFEQYLSCVIDSICICESSGAYFIKKKLEKGLFRHFSTN